MSTFTGKLISQKPTSDGQFNQWTLQHDNQQAIVLVPANMMKFYLNINLGNEYTVAYQEKEGKYILSEISVGTSSEKEDSAKDTSSNPSEPTTAEKMEEARNKQTKYMDDLLSKAETNELPIAALTTAMPEASFMINNNTQLDAFFTDSEEKEEKQQQQSQDKDEDLGTKDDMRKETEQEEAVADSAESSSQDNSSTTNHIKSQEEMNNDAADLNM